MKNRSRSRSVADSCSSARRGVSLSEMLVVISLSSILLGMAGMLMQQMLRADRSLIRERETGAKISRLDLLFRRDVWSAVESELSPTQQGSRLVLEQEGGRRVIYETEGRVLRRQVVVGQSEMNRDRFAFPQDSQVDIEQLATPRRARLTISTSTMPVDQPSIEGFRAPARQFRVEAAIGRGIYTPRVR